MPRVDLDPIAFRKLIRRRRRRGADRHDEVWNGVYVMSPLADNEHQKLGMNLAIAFQSAVADASVYPGCNVSDRDHHWKKNYRCPDVAVFLPGNPAQDRQTHWYGGPDFAVEILSRHDHSRAKLDFYARVQVRELLLIDRDPWRLELFRREGDRWVEAGQSDCTRPGALHSTVLPLTFRLIAGIPRPNVEITRPTDGATWLA